MMSKLIAEFHNHLQLHLAYLYNLMFVSLFYLLVFLIGILNENMFHGY